jgi:lipid II:glycine glycyltransferase (peptidoglycan interpeptide bridge formation enzyme)
MPQVTLPEWNQFLADHPNAHLLQMGEWGELKADFGWKPERIISDNIGAQILFRKLPLGFTVAYMPKPVFSEELSGISEKFWREVDAACRKNKAVFLKIEPDTWQEKSVIPNSSFSLSQKNIQPAATIVIDIRDAEDQILARMKQKCRYNIRLAEKKQVVVRAWDDISAFHEMMTVTGGRDGFGVHSKEYYQRAYELFRPKNVCELLVAEFEGRPLASLMVFANAKRAWYVYNRMPTYLLQWEAIRWAKARGCEEYDLWGVPDETEETLEAQFESRHDGLWGVYRFKRGFGGQLKRAAQALDKVYNPILYWAYLKLLGSRE